MSGEQALYKPSYYNIQIKEESGLLLFNGVTSALIRLGHDLAARVSPWLGKPRPLKAGSGYSSWSPPVFTKQDVQLDAGLFETLVHSGIFIGADQNERTRLKSDYVDSRTNAPFFITITTTLNCNMRCYYCYQNDDVMEHMSVEMCDKIIEWSKSKLQTESCPSLHVDWYGGEPMLNRKIIERYSAQLIPYCEEHGIKYRGSMICNGTEWPEDPEAFISANRITSIQITLDGAKPLHDKRRAVVGGDKGRRHRKSSFETVMRTVERLVRSSNVYLRINVDPFNAGTCLELIDEFDNRGLFELDCKFHPYLAIINAMTDHCGFIAKASQFSNFEEKFDQLESEFNREVASRKGSKVLEVIQYYPARVRLNCAAVSHNSTVFGPNGLMYKCGLDVGDHFRAHESIDGKQSVETNQKLPADRWDNYDPFSHSRCKECQFLPICMGGCPKAQIEMDEVQIRKQSDYWENNLEKILRQYAMMTAAAS